MTVSCDVSPAGQLYARNLTWCRIINFGMGAARITEDRCDGMFPYRTQSWSSCLRTRLIETPAGFATVKEPDVQGHRPGTPRIARSNRVVPYCFGCGNSEFAV